MPPIKTDADLVVAKVSRSTALIGAAISGFCGIVIAGITAYATGVKPAPTDTSKCRVERTDIAILTNAVYNQQSWIQKIQDTLISVDQPFLRQRVRLDLEQTNRQLQEHAAKLNRSCG